MKLTAVILTVVCMQVSASVYSQRISLSERNTPLAEVLKEIRAQSGYLFLYDLELMERAKPVTIEVKNASLETTLRKCLAHQPFTYEVINKTIVIKQEEKNEKAYTIQTVQPDTLRGTVTDSTGYPLPGISVMVKGTGKGTSTDDAGRYRLPDVPDDATLVFSMIGFQTQEVTVGSRTVIDLVLRADVASLEEVVVVGYGTQAKRDVTAAISSINSAAIKDLPVASAVEAMQGQVAGVDVSNSGGRPGQNPQVRIRGRRSIAASNDPLYVIDGIPQISNTGAVFDINPQDIESMEVLKDAAATAIYGSRGSNGVVIITTKRGKAGKTVVSYDGHYGISSVTRTVDMMNGEQFANMKREAYRVNAGGVLSWDGQIPDDSEIFLDPAETASLASGQWADYQDMVLGHGYQSNHQLSVSGGSEKTQFNISLGYFKEQGIISTMDFSRVTTRINLDHQLNAIFKAGVSATASFSIQNQGSNAVMTEALANNPLGQPYDENGNLNLFPTNDGLRSNPLSELVDGAYVNELKYTRILIPFYLEANIAKGLKYRANFGPDIRTGREGLFRGRATNFNKGGANNAQLTNNEDIGYTVENILTYDKSFNELNKLKVTLLQSIQSTRTEQHISAGSNLPYESQLFYNIGTAEIKGNLSSGLLKSQLASFMARINYDIAGKYLFQASLRADGSSVLAAGKKWKSFPGFSAGWRISDEEFLSGARMLDELKLRVSYGAVGNTAVSPYQTWGRLQRSIYAWGEDPALGYGLKEIANRDLGWEVSSTTDIGLDFSFLSQRLEGSIDIYQTNTSDLLLERALPVTSGYELILQNIGATRTRGIEFDLGASVLRSERGLNWDLDFNISSYREEIVDLALKDELTGKSMDDVGNEWFIGQPIRVFYDYRMTGIWQKDEAEQALAMENKSPGEIKLQDTDGDGIITPGDRVIIGSDVPDFYGGIRNRFSYNGFDLSFFFYWKFGQTIENSFPANYSGRFNIQNFNYWTIDNPSNEAPRPNRNRENPTSISSMRYSDGSFLKLRNVSLGYNFPSSFAQKLKASSLRIYLSGQNLWFWSKYDTYDPEIDENVIGASSIPSNKIFLLGLNVKF